MAAAIALPLQDKILLTFAEAGAFYGVSERLIYRLVANGQLPCVQVGGLRRIARSALEAFARDEVPASLLDAQRRRRR